MSPLTSAEFRERFPEFDSVSTDADIGAALETAQAMHGLRRLATLFCAAHLLSLDDGTDQPDGGQGEVVSESVGGMRSEYMAQAEAGREAFFTTTRYGRIFLALERRSAYGAPIRVY